MKGKTLAMLALASLAGCGCDSSNYWSFKDKYAGIDAVAGRDSNGRRTSLINGEDVIIAIDWDNDGLFDRLKTYSNNASFDAMERVYQELFVKAVLKSK